MRKNIVLVVIIFFILIANCTSTAGEQDSLNGTKPQVQVTSIRSTATLEIPTNTASSTKTLTLTSSIAPTIPTNTTTLTPTDVDWDQMPKLQDLILSNDEMKSLHFYMINNPDFELIDQTGDLVNECQLDCVKTKYYFKVGSVYIQMFRTENRNQAEQLSNDLRERYYQSSNFPFDYSLDTDLPMEPNSWLIMGMPGEGEYMIKDYSGMAYGDVVILLTHEQTFCFYDEELGKLCGDDIASIASDTAIIFSKQIDKLRAAGYAE